MSGLPRSGSTLLSSIFNQNPNIYSTTNSPVLKIISMAELTLTTSEQFRSNPKPECINSLLKGISQSYYAPFDRNIIIDKCRSWTNHIDIIKDFIAEEPKIICMVRDVLDILMSFIALHEKSGDRSIFNTHLRFENAVNAESICDYLMQDTSVVGGSYKSLKECFDVGNSKHLLLVEYEDLVRDPQHQMSRIYEFLGESSYTHDFSNIIQSEIEDPSCDVMGLEGLHVVRNSVEKIKRNRNDYFSEDLIKKYSGMEFWR